MKCKCLFCNQERFKKSKYGIKFYIPRSAKTDSQHFVDFASDISLIYIRLHYNRIVEILSTSELSFLSSFNIIIIFYCALNHISSNAEDAHFFKYKL